MNYKNIITIEDEKTAAKAAKGTIHIVDDDQQILQSLRDLIQYEGYLCLTYSSATDFLKNYPHIRFPGPQCILTDMSMPIHSGLDLQAKLQSENDHVFIFMSGISTIDQTSQAFRNGAFHFLSKPIHDHILFETIEQALEKSKSIQIKSENRKSLISKIEKLSPREKEVARLLAEGSTIKEIAQKLAVSDRAIKFYKKNFMDKLNISTNVDIVKIHITGLLNDSNTDA